MDCAANSWKLWRRNFEQAMRGVNSPTLPTRFGYRSDSRQHLNLSGGLKVDPDPRQTPPAGAGPMLGRSRETVKNEAVGMLMKNLFDLVVVIFYRLDQRPNLIDHGFCFIEPANKTAA
jgi:hypothetical protein